MTELTLNPKEKIILSAALECYINDRMMQIAEASDAGSESTAEFFERHVEDAEALLKRIAEAV